MILRLFVNRLLLRKTLCVIIISHSLLFYDFVDLLGFSDVWNFFLQVFLLPFVHFFFQFSQFYGLLRPSFSQFNNFRYGLCVFALRVVSFSCCFAQLLPPCIRSCSPFLGFGPPMTSASGPTSHVQTEEACDGSFESWLLGLLSPCLPSPCLFFYVFLYLRFSFSDSLPKWHKVSA